MVITNLEMDPVQVAKFHITGMFHQSHLLTTTETLPSAPHSTTSPINYCIGTEGSLIGERIAINPQDPDQLMVLVS